MSESKGDSIEIDKAEKDEPIQDDYLHGTRLIALTVSLLLGMFLVALDNTIIGTAIPKITDEFHDLNKVSWYGSAYFMTFGGSFQSTWGKVFKYFPLKLWFLIALLIFEIGSLVCGVAQDPTTLIVGRAIAGLGGSGVAVGVFTMLGLAASPEKRPQLLGFTGAAYVGGLSAIIIFFFFKPPNSAKPTQAPLKEKLLQMDFVGATLMIGLIISFILALQYGGQTHSWKSSQVIGLLVGFVVLVAVFVLWEIYQKERAMIVPRLRYVWVGSVFMFFFGGAYFVLLYYLPIYFQSIHEASPIGSGVRMLALIIPLTITAIVQGFALSKIGIVPAFWIFGGALATVGCGLIYTMDANTSAGKWIGYQILVGFATGLTFQVAIANAQVHAKFEDLSQVSAIINFFVTIGGAFFISAVQCAFNNQVIKELMANLPGIDPSIVLGIGATQIRQEFTSSQVPIVLDAYMVGLKAVFAITTAAYGISAIVGLFGSWKRLNEDEIKQAAGGAA
ncbi:unnamed protein product [Aureobasidium vineae]|uniref:Major facilitator superfamily (MFS) profile domain-containing protein n=1 Tax=Aureobasidium vineae TaxID=2773715 RepID=A0A9N8J7U1_9PEZI|nr:unnamed protein product [Aureobasidium vineae]